MMIIVLRFVDGLEHDYPYHLNLFTDDVSEHKGDLVWEQEHTFSPILSWRYPWVNWLILNFGYHNAHHAKPTAPWYELPSLHKQRFGEDPNTVIRLWPQLKMYHRYRTYRIFHDAPGIESVSGKAFLKGWAQEARLNGRECRLILNVVLSRMTQTLGDLSIALGDGTAQTRRC